ncbi:GMC family oxidoreductase [Pseudonocardia endophytica]|uniref:Choline dehydrogenase n=1 Tax=Pseudonocardia endophytica TaxID=401976 RepID=A0A4R1HI25_PSEEN|nr:GMC family oxidoreductase N-terminal domain-containing protein [Pseudonocardia endophytica]TCK21914.1 choline dehydrogenase [Pseudonocardia endophytica]
MTTEAFDYVVVGGGTAGCVVAARLTEDTQASVLLIEAGGDERRADVESPEGWPSLLGSDADWAFETVLQPGTGRACPAARGKVLGGSGSINNMVHLRGHAADFDGWAAAGAHGWDHAAVLPYFRRCEDVPDGDPLYRGRGGPLNPRPSGTSDPVGMRFAAGAERAGHERVGDLNAASMLGIGFPDALIFSDRRESTASAYLRPAMVRPNLHVRPNALARGLRIEAGRCTGVEYDRDGATHLATAAVEVVLCAGAVGSPHLLLLSGVGSADELAALGIEPVVHAPEVGHNLQDHPLLAGIRYRSERPLPPEYLRPTATVLARSGPDSVAPDLHITAAGMDFHYEWQHPLPNSITFAIGLMRVRSRGAVRLASADPTRAPVIDPGYLADPADVDTLITGVELVEEIVQTGVFDDWGGFSETTALLRLGRAELESAVRDAMGSYFHLAGTCRMGSDSRAVVDPELRVAGVDGLRVADASVMPTLVSCNSNAATVMIGEKAADLLCGRRTRGNDAAAS